jgi:hypothetical protein
MTRKTWKVERTVRQFIDELNHVFGFQVKLRATKSGFFLEGPGGEISSIGENSYSALLSPRDQETICENFGLDATLIGLNPRSD